MKQKGESVNIKALQDEMREYYKKHYFRDLPANYCHPFCAIMDEYDHSHPGLSSYELKSMQYEVIADNFEPILFRNSPLFFEMGVKPSECRGVPHPGLPASWLTQRNIHLVHDICPEETKSYSACSKHGIHLSYNFWDSHHHATNSTNIIRNGLESFYTEVEIELGKCKKQEEEIFLKSAMRGLLAVKKIAAKFADEADRKLKNATTAEENKFLSMISGAARKVPWKPAETFYEALAIFPFSYEVIASLEGNGLSAFGRMDYILGPLYENDIKDGRITRDDAYDLLCRVLCFTDCRYDTTADWKKAYNTGENGTALSLGGYADDGKVVCNDVSHMILDAHRELNLLFPKLQLRIAKDTPLEFYESANKHLLAGRNVIAFFNDDCIIPSHVKAGKKLDDARHYSIGACWEGIIEGYEHSAGANCYFNLLRILDISIQDYPDVNNETGIACRKLDGCNTFESVYERYLSNVLVEIRRMCNAIHRYGSLWPQVNPSPFLSVCMKDCIRNHTDYTAGGGRYNPHALPLGGFANTVDSLLAINEICFETKTCALDEFLDVLRRNWDGHEQLRQQAIKASHFGDNTQVSNSLAKRLFDDIYQNTRDLKNERGGPYQIGFYMAWEYINWGKVTGATPDGRFQGEVIANGITPSRINHNLELTSSVLSVGKLDLTQCPANASLEISLPLTDLRQEHLEAIERSFVAAGGSCMQPNCVNRKTLEDALINPANHMNLFVRIFGFSARFVLLPKEWQHEFMCRPFTGINHAIRLSCRKNRLGDWILPWNWPRNRRGLGLKRGPCRVEWP